ncbi:MAG: GNAT family N-acetyltransferase [Blastocatellales bacterium]
MTDQNPHIIIRNTRQEDFAGIIEMTRAVYKESVPWSETQLASHLKVFPEGQFVAVDEDSNRIVGMAASLIIVWDDYEMTASWRDFTDAGMFTNHDPEHGRTLYGAEVMTHPEYRRGGIGQKLYRARRELVRRLGLRRIRAGARLRNYHRHADHLTAEEYVIKVIRGEIRDPTLSFQLRQGFHVLAVVPNYLRHDPESLGYAAVIEWINERVAKQEDYARRDPRFAKPQTEVMKNRKMG